MLHLGFDKTGVTLIELIVTLTILSVLALGILPLSQITYKRSKEIQLRQNLRIIRKALDEYKRYADEKKISVPAFSSGYPENLDVLVNGVNLPGPKSRKKKFLRRLPRDPMTENGQWGLRAYADEPDSLFWSGTDVYDVYSTSDKIALDGTPYRNW